MELSDNDIDKLFKDNLSDLNLKFDPKAWNNMQKKIKAKKWRNFFLLGAFALISIATIAYISLNNSFTTNSIVENNSNTANSTTNNSLNKSSTEEGANNKIDIQTDDDRDKLNVVNSENTNNNEPKNTLTNNTNSSYSNQNKIKPLNSLNKVLTGNNNITESNKNNANGNDVVNNIKNRSTPNKASSNNFNSPDNNINNEANNLTKNIKIKQESSIDEVAKTNNMSDGKDSISNNEKNLITSSKPLINNVNSSEKINTSNNNITSKNSETRQENTLDKNNTLDSNLASKVNEVKQSVNSDKTLNISSVSKNNESIINNDKFSEIKLVSYTSKKIGESIALKLKTDINLLQRMKDTLVWKHAFSVEIYPNLNRYLEQGTGNSESSYIPINSSWEGKSLKNIDFGFNYSFLRKNRIDLSTGIHYSRIGYKAILTQETYTHTETAKFNFIDLRLNLNYHFNRRRFSPYIAVGPELNALLTANREIYFSDTEEKRTEAIDAQNISASFNLGPGVNYRFTNTWELYLQFNWKTFIFPTVGGSTYFGNSQELLTPQSYGFKIGLRRNSYKTIQIPVN